MFWVWYFSRCKTNKGICSTEREENAVAGSLSKTAQEQVVGAVERWLLCTEVGFLCLCTCIISGLLSLLTVVFQVLMCSCSWEPETQRWSAPPAWTESLKYLSLLCCFCAPLPIFYVTMNLPGKATVYTLNTSPWDLCGASHLCFVVICVLRSQTWVRLVQCQSTFVLYFTNEYLIALSAQVPVALLHWCAPAVSSCQPADFFSLQCKHSLGAVKEH